jgi:hypothetical protein
MGLLSAVSCALAFPALTSAGVGAAVLDDRGL